MPPEPDNKMDDVLKTYAKKRREEAGAPMEMHPATRRLLQAEAAKLKPATSRSSTSWFDALKTFWPRLAFAAAILFVASIMTITFLLPPNQKEREVFFAKQDVKESNVFRYAGEDKLREMPRAQTRTDAGRELEAVPELRDKSASKEALGRARIDLTELATATESSLVKSDAEKKSVNPAQNEPRNNVAVIREPLRPATVAPPANAPAESKRIQLGAVVDVPSNQRSRGAGGRPAPMAPTAPAPVADQIAGLDSKQTDALAVKFKNEKTDDAEKASKDAFTPARREVVVSQQLNTPSTRSRFANLQPAGRQSLGKAAIAYNTAVLANFVVEHTGEQLRMVDNDGSIYEGKVLYGEPATIGDYETNLIHVAGTRLEVNKPALTVTVGDGRSKQLQDEQRIDSPTASAWNFRVSGTNRTLQQPVVVDGVLYETAASNVVAQAGAKDANGSFQFYRLVPAQISTPQPSSVLSFSTLQNSTAAPTGQTTYGGQAMNLLNARRIQGQVRVGETIQLPLDAVPDGNQP